MKDMLYIFCFWKKKRSNSCTVEADNAYKPEWKTLHIWSFCRMCVKNATKEDLFLHAKYVYECVNFAFGSSDPLLIFDYYPLHLSRRQIITDW